MVSYYERNNFISLKLLVKEKYFQIFLVSYLSSKRKLFEPLENSISPFFKRRNEKRLHDLRESIMRGKKKKKEHNNRDKVKSSNTYIILSVSRHELVRPLIPQFLTDGNSRLDIHIHHLSFTLFNSHWSQWEFHLCKGEQKWTFGDIFLLS